MTHLKTIIGADKRFKEAMSALEKAKNIEDPDKRSETINKANRLIASAVYDKASIYDVIAFQLINAADLMLKESAHLIHTVEPTAKYKDKFNLSNAKKALEKIRKDFETESIKINEEYFKHGYTANSDMNVFDAIDQNSRLALCFIMLCYNSISQSPKNANEIELFLRNHEGDDPIFSIEEIESFKGNF